MPSTPEGFFFTCVSEISDRSRTSSKEQRPPRSALPMTGAVITMICDTSAGTRILEPRQVSARVQRFDEFHWRGTQTLSGHRDALRHWQALAGLVQVSES